MATDTATTEAPAGYGPPDTYDTPARDADRTGLDDNVHDNGTYDEDTYSESEDGGEVDGPPDGGKARRSRPRKSETRKIVEKTIEVTKLTKAKATVLSDVLGVADIGDRTDLAVAVVDDSSKAVSAVKSITEIISGDDMEAVATAVALAENKRAIGAAWRLAISLGADLPNRPSRQQAQAGLTLAKAVRNLDADKQDSLADIEAVLS